MPPDGEEDPGETSSKDEAIRTTHEGLSAIKRSTIDDHRLPHELRGDHYVVTSGESSGKTRQPSSAKLYEDQLIENNMRCYIQ